MKTFNLISLLSFLTTITVAQTLVIDSTRFVSGNRPSTSIYNAIPTADKGILFSGETYDNPGGIIPYFPLDTVLSNVLIGKIDSNRQISWIKVYGGSEDDGAGPSCQTPDGGYAVLANTSSDNGDVTGFKGATDIWLLRIDANGNLLWQKCYGSSQSDGAMSIANTPDHGFIILGSTNGSDGDVPFHYGGFFSQDWLLIKIDSMGNKQWSRDLGSTGYEGETGSVLASNGGYYLVSMTDGKDHDCTDTIWHSGVNTGVDVYVLKIDTTGNILWDSSYGGTNGDGVSSAMYDTRDSTIIVAGGTNSNDYMVTGYHSCTDQGDIWVLKIDKFGKLLWEKTLGSVRQEGGEGGAGICPMPGNGYLVYGSTEPLYCHDATIGDIGAEDCWLFALDHSGDVMINKIFGGVDNENPYAVIPYLNGYADVGNSGSSVFTEGTCNTNYSGAFISYISFLPLSVPILNDSTFAIAIYPNPAQEVFRVEAPNNPAGRLTVLNSIGQRMYDIEVKKANAYEDVDVGGWGCGIYLVIWKGENGNVATAKLIKN